ncbi:MAG: Rpn family recombination-promoting nuclease/putative transposase [Sedimentisphaerales bacterium]|nr:Rpn family recombination-promoting nuclease/putative transposase [Sedimentisphaerales bacterium]
MVETTFVERDYRHVESDVVLLAPLRRRQGERTARVLLIYILIEHQSEPDRLMPLRSVDYVVQTYIVYENRPSGRICSRRSKPRSKRTNIARRFSRCAGRLPTN